MPSRELHNLHVSLSDLWQQDAHDLYEQMLSAQSYHECFAVLERALMCRLNDSGLVHPAVNYALDAFDNQSGDITIGRIVDQLSISHTRFIQVFRDAVGLTPKRYWRIQRLQSALRRIAECIPLDWAELALASGYYDQAHLINDFQHLAGITPTAYRPQFPDHLSNIPFEDGV